MTQKDSSDTKMAYYHLTISCGHHAGFTLTEKEAKELLGTKGVCYEHGIVTIKAYEKVKGKMRLAL